MRVSETPPTPVGVSETTPTLAILQVRKLRSGHELGKVTEPQADLKLASWLFSLQPLHWETIIILPPSQKKNQTNNKKTQEITNLLVIETYN